MGVKAVRRVLEHSRATGTDRLVLVILAEYADDQKCVCWPSVATIAKEAKVRARAAQAALCRASRDWRDRGRNPRRALPEDAAAVSTEPLPGHRRRLF